MGPRPCVVGFTGVIASGKSTISKAVALKLSLPWAGFGSYLKIMSGLLGFERPDREVLQDLGEFLAKHPEVFCRKFLQYAQFRPDMSLIIDGIRHLQVLDELKLQSKPVPVHLVHVMADEESLGRRRSDSPEGLNWSRTLRHSTEADVYEKLCNASDFVIDNSDKYPIQTNVDAIINWLQ